MVASSAAESPVQVCDNCCDAVVDTKQTEEGWVACPCGTQWYCSTECRGIHWRVHRLSCRGRGRCGGSGAVIGGSQPVDDLLLLANGTPLRSVVRSTTLVDEEEAQRFVDPATIAAAVRLGRSPTTRSAPHTVDIETNTLHIPKYIIDAERIIAALSKVEEGKNVYAGLPSYINLDDSDPSARTQCATFVSRLWKFSYGITDKQLRAWLHSDLVWGEDYYNHIVANNGFQHIKFIQDVAIGDIMAMKYERTAFNTGHVMLIRHLEKRDPPTPPLVDNTVQWTVKIIDSTKTHHMQGDSRYKPNPPGGIGSGYCRLYSDAATGLLVGYTWSTWDRTVYYGEGGPRLLAVGRPTQLLAQVEHRVHGRTASNTIDNFDFASSEDVSANETSGPDDEEIVLKCGEATAAIGKELLRDGDYREAGTVWYTVGRNVPKGGVEAAKAMIVAAECYREVGKFEASMRCAEKALLEARNELVQTPNKPHQLPAATAAESVRCQILAHVAKAGAETGIGFDAQTILSLRAASYLLNHQLKVPSEDVQMAHWKVLMQEHIQNQIASGLRVLHPKVRLVRSPTLGLTLRSAVAVAPGECLLTEEPLLVWRDNAILGAEESSFVSPSLFKEFVKLSEVRQQLILSLHTASISPGDAQQLEMMVRAVIRKELGFTDSEDDKARLQCLPTSTAVKLALIAHCNSHSVEHVDDEGCVERSGAPGESYSALFDMMSKVQHSCTPNMFYDGERRAYYAMKHIGAEEELSFSYAGRNYLSLSTDMRRKHLHQQFMFYCKCNRCSGPDYSRGVKCALPVCLGMRYHHVRDGLWKCEVCGERWCDAEDMAAVKSKEEKLQTQLNDVAAGIYAGQLIKNQFDNMKTLLLDVHATYGHYHWLYLECCRSMVRFFINIGTTGATGRSAITRLAALRQASRWTEQFLQAAIAQRLLDEIPMAIGEEVYTQVAAWGTEQALLAVKLKAFRFLYPLYLISFPEGRATKTIRDALRQSQHGLPQGDAEMHSGNGVGDKRGWTLLPEAGVDQSPADLCADWERFLAERLSSSLNSNRNMQLPPSLAEAMKGGNSVVQL